MEAYWLAKVSVQGIHRGLNKVAKCLHLDHVVSAKIFRLVKDDQVPVEESVVTGWSAEIIINCKECGLPFEFIGLECGMMPDKPMCDPSAQELRAPIKPKGSLVMPGIPGFAVRAM